jgi:D-3-phosphoglycerate dehydrogenase
MGDSGLRLNIFVNEPDIYECVDFQAYDCLRVVQFARAGVVEHGNYDAVLVGLKEIIDDAFLSRFGGVQYIASNTTGVDHIRAAGSVQIIHLEPGEIERVSATAEFTLGLLLSVARKIPFVDPERVGDRLVYRGVQLRGRRLGIFGMGRLGRKMARYAEALDMSWQGYDREDGDEEKREILKSCDVITLHLPLSPETIGFIGWKEFDLMGRRPFLLNTSRPQLVEKRALVDALERSRIAGAAMDFINYDGSDVCDPCLRKYMGEKLLMTPHIAGNTYESVQYTARVVVDKLIRKFRKDSQRRLCANGGMSAT